VQVIECDKVQEQLLHLQWPGRRGQTKKERKQEKKKEIIAGLFFRNGWGLFSITATS